MTRYKLKVVAHNQRGEANIAAQEVIGYSGESEPSEAPKLFTLREVIITTIIKIITITIILIGDGSEVCPGQLGAGEQGESQRRVQGLQDPDLDPGEWREEVQVIIRIIKTTTIITIIIIMLQGDHHGARHNPGPCHQLQATRRELCPHPRLQWSLRGAA